MMEDNLSVRIVNRRVFHRLPRNRIVLDRRGLDPRHHCAELLDLGGAEGGDGAVDDVVEVLFGGVGDAHCGAFYA